MNALEAGTLLIAIQAFDHRDVNEVTMRAWATVLPDVPLNDALGVVAKYFQTSDGIGINKLMPVHIIEGVENLHTRRLTEAYGQEMDRKMAEGMTRDEARPFAREARARAEQGNPLARQLEGQS